MKPNLEELACIDVVRCDGYKMRVADISVNAANKTVAVASMSGEAHILSIKDGTVQGAVSEPVRLPLTSIAINCDGTLLATGATDRILRVFNLEGDGGAREIASSQAHQSFVTCVAFARRNPLLLASGGGDKPIVRIWETDKGKGTQNEGAELLEKCVLVGHWAFVSGLAFSDDDRSIVSCCLHGTIRVWDVVHGEPMVNMSFASSVVQDRTCMQVLRLQHVTHRQMEQELSSDGSDVRFLWEREDLPQPLRLCRVPDTDGWGRQVESRYQYVDAQTGEVIYTSSGWLRTLKGHCGAVNHVDWSPDGKHLVSAGDDGTVRMWDAQCRINEEVVLDDRFLEGTEGHHVLAIEDEMVAGEETCSMRIEADDVVHFQIVFSQVSVPPSLPYSLSGARARARALSLSLSLSLSRARSLCLALSLTLRSLSRSLSRSLTHSLTHSRYLSLSLGLSLSRARSLSLSLYLSLSLFLSLSFSLSLSLSLSCRLGYAPFSSSGGGGRYSITRLILQLQCISLVHIRSRLFVGFLVAGSGKKKPQPAPQHSTSTGQNS